METKKCNHCGKGEPEFCHECFEGLLNQNIELKVKLHDSPTKNVSESILEAKDNKIKRLEQEVFSLRLIHVNDVKMVNEKLKDCVPKDTIINKIHKLEEEQKYCNVETLRSTENQIDILKELLEECDTNELDTRDTLHN